MDIEYIKRFVVVAQCLNFSRAADILFISQPTLSHSIAALEKKLNTPLLVRNTKTVKLTHAGELFLPAALEIMERYQRAVNEISRELHLDSGVLNIGYTGPSNDNMLPAWTMEFRKICPDAKIHIVHYSSTKIAQAFQDHAIHLGVMYKMNADSIPGLKYQQVGKEKFKALLNREHPLANCSSIDLAQLKDEPFLICERTCSPNFYDSVLKIWENRGLHPQISQSVELIGDIYRLVGAGLGVAIMSYSESRSYEANNVKFVDIGTDEEEDLLNPVVIAWAGKLSQLGRQFRDIVKKDASF